ncbi:hypothetical protein NDK43_06665 [Neobacillus pocheonensis]|uniref:Uncharacterized protein n=1 Tax=Neobacillus pocheonensis TaxID=363869 RepID=A0ABT0W732_9BACI|nr:hypothetical protein [Neobacillus pocheonensis]
MKNKKLLGIIAVFIIMAVGVVFITMLHSSGASWIIIAAILVIGAIIFRLGLM